MKKDGKYRFSLQFPADSEEQTHAGELLDRLGNRKSIVVVAALNEYLAAHPELLGPDRRVEIQLRHRYGRAEIEALIRAILAERLTDPQTASPALTPTKPYAELKVSAETESMQTDIAQMLENLDAFF